MNKPTIESAESIADRRQEDRVRDAARRLLKESCSYHWYYSNIEMHFHDRTLSLYGSVPSYYLKQILQNFLIKLDEVEQIDNQVNVISSDGLSSVESEQASDKERTSGDFEWSR